MALDAASAQDTTCYLLRLPRELRDQIYAYALYEDDGIIFYRDQKHKSTFVRSKHDLVGINQLQYTCLQLRRETKNLEMKLNDLVFLKDTERQSRYVEQPPAGRFLGFADAKPRGGYIDQSPADQFLGFLDMCNETRRQRLRHIHLKDTRFSILDYNNDGYLMLSLHQVVYICQRYPDMLVMWHMNLLNYIKRPTSFLLHGLMWACACRSNSGIDYWLTEVALEPVWGLARANRDVWHAKRRRKCHTTARRCERQVEAANFRFMPFNTKGWEEEFRRNLLESKGEGKEDVVEKGMALARQWSEKGI